MSCVLVSWFEASALPLVRRETKSLERVTEIVEFKPSAKYTTSSEWAFSRTLSGRSIFQYSMVLNAFIAGS